MSLETVCMVCCALKNMADNPGVEREAEAYMKGYVAGMVHTMSSRRDPDVLAALSLEGCVHHSMQMIAHTQRALTAFMKDLKEKTP